jgi:hypothetical protein
MTSDGVPHQVGEEMSTEQISSLLAILPSAEDAELVQVGERAQIEG